eukprot:scaffold5629_cov48-Cyclotella_meneghiniana.AAC.4
MTVDQSSFFINVSTPATTTTNGTLFTDDVSPFPTFDEDSLISNNSIETEPVRESESDESELSADDDDDDSESEEEEDDDDSSSDDSSAPPLPEDIGYVIDANGVSLLANLNRKMLEHRYGKDYKFDKVPVTTKIDVDEAVCVMEKMKGLLQDGSVSREDFEMAVIPKSPSSASEIMTRAYNDCESNNESLESPKTDSKDLSTKDLEQMMKSLSKDDLQVLYKAIMGKEIPEDVTMNNAESRQDCDTGKREENDPFDMPLPSILEESLSGSTATIESATKNVIEEEQRQDIENVAAVANKQSTPKKGGFGLFKKLNGFKKKVTGKKKSDKKTTSGKNLADRELKPTVTAKPAKKMRLSPIAFLQAASGANKSNDNVDVEERDSPEPTHETLDVNVDESKRKENPSPESTELTESESTNGKPSPEEPIVEPELVKGPTDESEQDTADVVEAFDSLCLSLGSPRTTAATNVGTSQDDEQHCFDDAVIDVKNETQKTLVEEDAAANEPLETNNTEAVNSEMKAASMEESVEVADVMEEQKAMETGAEEPVVKKDSDVVSVVSDKSKNSVNDEVLAESVEVELAPDPVLPEVPLSPATVDTGEKSFGRRFSKALRGKSNKPTSPGAPSTGMSDDIKLTPENPVIEIPLSEMKPRRSLMSKYAEKKPKAEPISPKAALTKEMLENGDIKLSPENPVIEIPLSDLPKKKVISPVNKKPQAVGLEHVSLTAESSSPKAKETENWKSADISVSSKKSSKSKKSTKAKKKKSDKDDHFVVKANDTLDTRDECSLRGFTESSVESFEEAGNIMFCCMRDPNAMTVEKSFTQFFDYCDHTPEEAYENTKLYRERHSTEDEESLANDDCVRSRSKTRSDKLKSNRSYKSRSKSRGDKSVKSKGDKSTKSRSNKSTKSKSEKSIKSKGEKSMKSKGEKSAKSSKTKKVSNTTAKATPTKDVSKVSSSANDATAKAPATTATAAKTKSTNAASKNKSTSMKTTSLKINTKAKPDVSAGKTSKSASKVAKPATPKSKSVLTKSSTSNAVKSKNSASKTNANATKLQSKTKTASKKLSKRS